MNGQSESHGRDIEQRLARIEKSMTVIKFLLVVVILLLLPMALAFAPAVAPTVGAMAGIASIVAVFVYLSTQFVQRIHKRQADEHFGTEDRS